MMKVRWSPRSNVWLECDVSSPKEAVKELSNYSELFRDSCCGVCKSTNITLEHRCVDSYEFFSLRCMDCGAELSFGQTKDGKRLFAKRKLEDGSYDREHFGWKKFQRKQDGNGGGGDYAPSDREF
jgi:hypothetical protein